MPGASPLSRSRSPRTARALAAAVGLGMALTPAPPASAQAPLSAIDWLRDSVEPAPEGLYPLSPPGPDLWLEGAISVRPLDPLRPESVGLFPAQRVGLPRDLWGPTGDEELAVLIRALPTDTLPALRDLGYRLLLAELDAPRPQREPGAGESPIASAFLVARIDKLIELGAIDQASALLDTLDPVDATLRQRRFEIALLLGEEERACPAILRPDPPAHEAAVIFCQARAGDWPGAEARLERAVASGSVGATDGALLRRFLDIDDHLHSADAPPLDLPPPARLSPLAWRLLEAIGEPVASHGLPVAFAHADLRGTSGWRAQLEAAERLVRAGALSANRLLGLYTERSPAASGGIWERVRAVQRLDSALSAGDPAAIGAALTAAWPHVVAGELEIPFAALFAPLLPHDRLAPEPARLAWLLRLLSDDYEMAALEPPQAGARERVLIALARGLQPDAEDLGNDPLKAAIAEAFADPPPVPATALARIAEGRRGEEILLTLIRLGSGNDPRTLGEGLAVLRHLGLEDSARRAALQSILLERRG